MTEIIHTIGRRKTSVARLFLNKGKGKIMINDKEMEKYFPLPTLQYKILKPLSLTNSEKIYDLKITVKGGGFNGQAEAIQLAISRALCKTNDENHSLLKPEGLLGRDPRMVERKKFGQKKARKKHQDIFEEFHAWPYQISNVYLILIFSNHQHN